MSAIVTYNHKVPESDAEVFEILRIHESAEPNYYHFGIIDRNPITGKWIVTARLGQDHVGNEANIYYWQSDDSLTWGSRKLLYDHITHDCRTGAGGFTSNGRFYFFCYVFGEGGPSEHLGVVMRYSDDDGETWSDVEWIYTSPTITQFISPYSRMIHITNGTHIMGCYGYDNTNYSVGYMKYTGTIWSYIVVANTGLTYTYAEPTFIEIGTNNILMLARKSGVNPTNTPYHQWYSSNGGDTWEDQGDTTFDSWNVDQSRERPPYLSSINYMGQNIIACYYANSTDKKLRVIYGLASDFAIDGVSAWNIGTILDLEDLFDNAGAWNFTRDGYQSVIHFPNNWIGRGVYYSEPTYNTSDVVIFNTPGNNRVAVWAALGL